MYGHGAEYIKRYYPNAFFSEPLWLISPGGGATTAIVGDYSDRGAVAIYVWSIVILRTAASTPFIIKDNAGISLFEADAITQPGFVNFEYVFKGPILNLSCTAKVTFSVGFQYITLEKKL